MVQGPEKVDLRASHVLDADVLLLIFGQIQPHTLDYVPAISLYITTYHHITTIVDYTPLKHHHKNPLFCSYWLVWIVGQ